MVGEVRVWLVLEEEVQRLGVRLQLCRLGHVVGRVGRPYLWGAVCTE
jgi:hypothetical protein